MRGGPKIHFRAGDRAQPVNEAIARPFSHPAPYGGWNARGNLANMPSTDAIQMDNVFPDVQEVELRKGSITWATGFTAPVKMLLAYNGPTTSRLFASTNTEIFNVTASGAIGAAVTTCTSGQWSYVNFTTPGGSFLVMANGFDAVKNYNGTAWTTPAITGVTPSTLSYVTSHQKRLWFVQGASMNLWYLPVESIAGAAVQFPVGSLFKRGGYVVAIGSWTVDSGSGSNDLFVIVTSEGEIAVYQGTDPASSATWALVGVYSVPLPLGNRPLTDYGGDLLYLSQNGIIPVSELAQSVIIERNRQVSFKIDGAFLDAAEAYKGNVGWQMALHKTANFLVVNVPVSVDTVAYQFVMNTITKAWCRFLGWNASCWASLGSDLYFAGGGAVYKAWQGLSDSGAPITGTVIQAYSPLGSRSQKNIGLVRPNIGFSGAAQITMALDADFRSFAGQTTFNYAPTSTAAIWDSSLWGTGLWDSGSVVLEPTWQTIPGELGYLHSFRLQITSSQSTFSWTSTDFATRGAGIL
jgi:hypothetical protein